MISQLRSSLNEQLKRIPPSVRRLRTLVPVVVVLLLILATAAVLGAFSAKTQAAATASLLIARADFHSETPYQGKDLELNLTISAVENDCQAPLNGGYCLRYSAVLEEQAVMVGYGVIPASDVQITATSITVSVNTTKVPKFVHVYGTGGQISVTWKTASTAGKVPSALINKPQKATAQGAIAAYTAPSSAVIATVIYH